MKNVIRFKQIFYQLFMWICMFNLTYFVACSVIFFKYGNTTDTLSLVLFSLKGGIFIYMVFKFLYTPYNFKYFWNSFKNRKLAMNHYLIYTLVIIFSVILLGVTSSWAPLIPYVFMLLYTLAYKPYK